MDLTLAQWFTSSRSSGNGNCVEVAFVDGKVAVRDTKDRAGGVLGFAGSDWDAFVAGVKDGEFDLP